MNKIKKVYLLRRFCKYIFVWILFWCSIVNAQNNPSINNITDNSSTWYCATCSGPSDQIKNYRKFLSDSIDSITLRKQARIIWSDNVIGILKNADSNIKNINYNSRFENKKIFRSSLYNNKDSVMGIADYSKDLLKFGNNITIKELQNMDKYSDIIDQLAIKLIQSNQINQLISNQDISSLQKVLTKYTNWSKKIFSSSVTKQLKWKTYSDYMRFLLITNLKLQFFIVNGTLKDINTNEFSLDTDLAVARDPVFVKNIAKSYDCSRELHICDKTQKDLNSISKDFAINSKYQKSQINIAIWWLKNAMSRFNNIVLWIQDPDFGANYTDELNKVFGIDSQKYKSYDEWLNWTKYKWWNNIWSNFGSHFQINTQIDSKIKNLPPTFDKFGSNIQNTMTDFQDSVSKIKNAQSAKALKKEIIKQQQELDKSIKDYKISTNDAQLSSDANTLALAKQHMNDFIVDSMIMQDDFMDKNILSESESVTKLFPNLSKAVYANVNNIWNRSENDSCLTNFVDMCKYQCANLWWKCEPSLK